MTTFLPIQPRPIVSKPTTATGIQYSPSPHYSSQVLAVANNHVYSTNAESNSNHSSAQTHSMYSMPLSPAEEFLKRLRDFHRGRQTAIRSLPIIGGHVVDLYVLYNTVVNSGGWEKVNDRHLWPTIANGFSLDETCLNGTQALKNIYLRYLYAFEKVSSGENIDVHDNDNDDGKRRTMLQLQRVPQSYNYAQHSVPEGLRVQHGLFTDFVPRTEFEKLELALICGFPNEITFTLNTLLLLSSSPIHTRSFHLYKCPRLLDLLYRHVGLFLPSDTLTADYHLKPLYNNLWSQHLNYRMESFWRESCSSSLVKLLLNMDSDNASDNLYENFNVSFNPHQQEQEFRIEQILMIIRNLSFDRVNALFLLDTIRLPLSLTYRFLLLVSSCQKHAELQKYAFDIWTNLASFMHLRWVSNNEGLLFRQLLTSMLNGDDNPQQDRLQVIRALEIMANLAQAGSDNGSYLIDYIPMIVKGLIHVPDILVLVHTLECLYQLSELGEQACDAFLHAESTTAILSTLIDLLTIEARSFSAQTIKTIKIVEMSSGPMLLPSHPQPVKAPQPMVLIPAQQPYALEPVDITRAAPKYIIQQHSKPLVIGDLRPPGNILTVTTTQPSNINEKKRKLDAQSDIIATIINDTSKRTRLHAIPPKTPIAIRPTSVVDDETNLTISDLLDRCSAVDSDARACLNDLCQRVSVIVDQSLSDIFNQLPSPVFIRKTTAVKEANHVEEHAQPPRYNQSIAVNTFNPVPPAEKTEGKSPTTYDYFCEWDNCRASFPTARSVLHHVCSSHIKHQAEFICLWSGCDRLKRQKWALISHVQDRHCSEVAFRQAKLRMSNGVPTTVVNPAAIPVNSNRPSTHGNSMGYASDAAWFAIQRHMQVNAFDDFINKSKEGPLTKSIRLTAALILRNIARHSSAGKQNLRQYEQLLANLTLESSEASHVLSSCLFELYN